MQFLCSQPDGTYRVSGHPGWSIGDTPETSRRLTAEELVDHGYGLILVDEPPPHDPATQKLVRKDPDEWLTDARRAYVTYDVEDLPVPTLEELRAAMPPLSPRQIRLGLASIGIAEAQVDALLAEDAMGMIEWKHATEFMRTHPLVTALSAALSLPDEQIDALWVWAASL